jgi:hypothetical protein
MKIKNYDTYQKIKLAYIPGLPGGEEESARI